MKPAPFAYVSPSSVDEAVALLNDYGDTAKLLAGGQSLLPMMNFRLARPTHIIDLNRVQGLDYIIERDDTLRIGAMTRHRRLEQSDLIARHYPLLREAASHIGHTAIRNRGTVGGSLAHADPAAELPAILLAYGGSVMAQGVAGRREVTADELFLTYFTTTLEHDEILTEIRLPRWPQRTGWCFLEESRRHGDFAMLGVAALVTLDARASCTQAAVTITGVGGAPFHVPQAASILVGQPVTTDAMRELAQVVATDVEPESDIHASAEFRRHLSAVLTQRALAVAVDRAHGLPTV